VIAAVVKERTADGVKGKGDVVKVERVMWSRWISYEWRDYRCRCSSCSGVPCSEHRVFDLAATKQAV